MEVGDRRPLVYLAAIPERPLTVDELGVHLQSAVGIARSLDHYVGCDTFVPDSLVLWQLIDSRRDDDWGAWRRAMILRCDALYRVSSVRSELLDAEVKFAQQHGIEAFDDVGKLSKWVERWQEVGRYRRARLLHLAADRLDELNETGEAGSIQLAEDLRAEAGPRPPAPMPDIVDEVTVPVPANPLPWAPYMARVGR